MAIIKVVNSRASIGKAINYVRQEEKTEECLVSGKDCNPTTAIDEMKATKQQWRKTDGRQYKHYIQSFDKEDKIAPDKAHQIGCEWAEKNFKGHEVLIATHKDKDHIHNHFIVNTVNYENGKKFQQSKKDLENLKRHSDEICEREGLSVIKEKGKEITSFDQKKYRAIEKGFTGKGKSYVLDTAKDVSSSLKKATDKESFIKDMESKGYKVNWSDNRENITYTTPDEKKVRSSNLEKTFKEHKFSKEGMEYEIQRNRENGRTSERTGSDTQRYREITEGNDRTQQANARLHTSTHERRYHEENDSRKRTGKHEKDQSRGTKSDGIDITKAREHAEILRREAASTYGKWQDRNNREQSDGIKQNGTDRKDAQNKHEPNGKDNGKQLTESKDRGWEYSR